MVIYSKVKLGVSPDINALASIIVCAVGACVIAAGYLMVRGDRRRAAEIASPAARAASAYRSVLMRVQVRVRSRSSAGDASAAMYSRASNLGRRIDHRIVQDLGST